MNTRITRTSTKGLHIVYDSQLSAIAQLNISWNNGLGGGVAMSIQQAEELQFLLSEVLRLASPALAQPELPEPPELTDEEIDDWCGECSDLTRAGEADHYWVFGDVQGSDINAIVRAAIARWGCPTPPPRKP
jgi:hypothetical protein